MAGQPQKLAWRWAIFFSLLLMILGCGSPQQRYRILSFFFDGVPNPDAPKGVIGRASTAKPSYVHQPYAEKNCNACHENTTDIFARAKVRPTICRDCHAAVFVEYPRMHGPVASGMCLACHSPHLSQEKHLLTRSSPKLCTQCHELPALSTKVSQHQDPKASCATCHSGHGGSDRHFLLAHDSPATTQPLSPEVSAQ